MRLLVLGLALREVNHGQQNHFSAMIGLCQLALVSLEPDHPAAAQVREVLAVARKAADLSAWLAAFAAGDEFYMLQLVGPPDE